MGVVFTQDFAVSEERHWFCFLADKRFEFSERLVGGYLSDHTANSFPLGSKK
jgi:hypothetical protein